MPDLQKIKFTPATSGVLAQLDATMLSHPAMPRVVPYFLYVAGITFNSMLDEYLTKKDIHFSYPIGYTCLCIIIALFIWRYRKLTPEINCKFHWLAIPTGLGVIVAWIGLGWYFSGQFDVRYEALINNNATPTEQALNAIDESIISKNDKINFIKQKGPLFGYASLIVRVMGMSLLVPFLEEVLMRSLLLRALSNPIKSLKMAFVTLSDLPGIGEILLKTNLSKEIDKDPPSFEDEFNHTPLGALTFFGILASTLFFAVGHAPRDYAGAFVCGITWCILLRVTKSKGLGPVIWSHGIANAALVAYVLCYNDWQFL